VGLPFLEHHQQEARIENQWEVLVVENQLKEEHQILHLVAEMIQVAEMIRAAEIIRVADGNQVVVLLVGQMILAVAWWVQLQEELNQVELDLEIQEVHNCIQDFHKDLTL
jgi:K+ transporter